MFHDSLDESSNIPWTWWPTTSAGLTFTSPDRTEPAALSVTLNPSVAAGWLLQVRPKPWLSNNKWIWIKNKTLPEYKQMLQDMKCAEPLLSAAYTPALRYSLCHRSRLCARPLCVCACVRVPTYWKPKALYSAFPSAGVADPFFFL